MRARVALVGSLLSAVLLCACPDPNDRGPVQTCVKADEKCVLPTGVLGVCNTVDCAENQPAPCLVCRSQH